MNGFVLLFGVLFNSYKCKSNAFVLTSLQRLPKPWDVPYTKKDELPLRFRHNRVTSVHRYIIRRPSVHYFFSPPYNCGGFVHISTQQYIDP